MEQVKKNRLETPKKIGPMINNYWENLRRASKEGKKTAWNAGPLLWMTKAMDIPTHEMPAYAAWAGGKHAAVELIAVQTIDCSYGFCFYRHLNKPKSPGVITISVPENLGRRHLPKRFKRLP